MKRQFTLLALLFAMMTLSLPAATWTVSNNTNSPGQYTNLQTAIDAAAPYDTILVAGSPSSYGNITIGKTLYLVGAGYHNPYGDNTTLGTVKLYTTSLNFSSASGSKIIGFITGVITLSADFYGSVDSTRVIKNVVIERCNFSEFRFGEYATSSTIHNSYKNDTIRNCLIGGIGIGYRQTGNYPNYTYTCYEHLSNIYIHNNIFSGGAISSPAIAYYTSNFYVENNIFIARQGYVCFGLIPNMVIENNIFYAAEPQGCTGSAYTKNITYMCLNNTIPGAGNVGSGNMVNVNPLFVNYPLMGNVGFSYSHDYHLQATSPGKNAGTDGTDIGIYGGMMPFEVGANPYYPQMMELTLPNGSSVPAGGTLNVHFKAKKQN